MSLLRVYRDERNAERYEEYSDPEAIAGIVAEAGLRFERWCVSGTPATDGDVFALYAEPVERLKQARGFVTADILSMTPATANPVELRKKFLVEHVHDEDEARFFVEGRGLFYIHHDTSVYAIRCEASDLINVPAGTKHWFDAGDRPFLRAIRLFTNPEGWVAKYTGSDIASRFPCLVD